MGGHGVAFFGLELVPPNPDPTNPQEVIPLNAALAQVGQALHGWGGNLLVGAIVLPVVGALKHQLIDRDATLRCLLGDALRVAD
ncbi:cytochrome b [Thiorhodococcus minor]|uniref:cytochrome b n=1 Tax=Thiorhodococcus minor TaxID=57489 RepID=UPI001ADA62FD|nr:hypothetical protein [Thiorhodococcus minor]